MGAFAHVAAWRVRIGGGRVRSLAFISLTLISLTPPLIYCTASGRGAFAQGTRLRHEENVSSKIPSWCTIECNGGGGRHPPGGRQKTVIQSAESIFRRRSSSCSFVFCACQAGIGLCDVSGDGITLQATSTQVKCRSSGCVSLLVTTYLGRILDSTLFGTTTLLTWSARIPFIT